MAVDFARQLIKGRIAEVIFEQMIRDEGKYTVIPFGYEHTTPMLAQYRHISEIPKIMDNIADAPDFALISETEKTKVYLVEVKYQRVLDIETIKGFAKKLLERWEYPWIFVATPGGFYCSLCQWILEKGSINSLSENWAGNGRRAEYLNLLKEFEK